MTNNVADYEKRLRSKSKTVRYDAALEISELGTEAVPILFNALKEDQEEVSQNAIIGIIIWTNRKKDREDIDDIDEEQIQKALKPITEYLIDIVSRAEISTDIYCYTGYVASAITALGNIGDPVAIPSLKKILGKVQNIIDNEGVDSEYVETNSYAGYYSTEDNVYHIESAIKRIRGKGMEKSD